MKQSSDMQATKFAAWSELTDCQPAYALVANVDLVIIRYDEQVSVFYGRCLHRGALLSDGTIRGEDLICGVHNWDYRYDTGVSAYNNEEALPKFSASPPLVIPAPDFPLWSLAGAAITLREIW